MRLYLVAGRTMQRVNFPHPERQDYSARVVQAWLAAETANAVEAAQEGGKQGQSLGTQIASLLSSLGKSV